MTTTDVERPILDPRPEHRSPYTLGQFHERYPWVLPIGMVVFLLLAIGAAANALFWDQPITDWFVAHRTDSIDTIVRRISWFGSTKVVLVVAAAAAAIAWPRCRRLALAIIAIALARPLIEHVLKELVGRERPQGDQLVPGRGPSFPSGHPLATAASWGLIPLVVGLYTPRREIWWTTAVCVWFLAVMVAISRVYLGVHYLSDVVGSLILATIGVLGAEWFIDKVHGAECTPHRVHRT